MRDLLHVWYDVRYWSKVLGSILVAEQLALPPSDHGVAGSNLAGGEILPEPKRRFIAQSLSCSPFHHLEMTEILLKGCKTLTHPHPSKVLGSTIHSTVHDLRNFMFNFTMSVFAKPLMYLPFLKINEPPHNKTNKMTCTPSKDSDQPGHPSSLIKVFAVRSLES